MTISAKVIADSVSPDGIRITTMQLRYPKFIHGEFMTHRVFSRNASSSRAIPVERLIKDVLDDPVYPSFWGKNQAGMQAREECAALIEINLGELDYTEKHEREAVWDAARDKAIETARAFAAAGYHKQIINRLLEPFCHINVVCTSTEWHNFYDLRCHPDAQPEMRELAEKMRAAQDASTPFTLTPGSHCPWHLPYVTIDEWKNNSFDRLVKLSVARCARVSYLTQDGRKPSVTEDLALYDRLVGAVPAHASPAEHQATPDAPHPQQRAWRHPELHGNFFGWIQYRKLLEEEQALKMAMPEKLP